MRTALLAVFFFLISFISLIAQEEASYRPGLFFREDWTQTPDHSIKPLQQEFLANKDLLLHVYGTAVDSLSKSHHDKPVDDPYYIWSGRCSGSWMVALEHKTKNMDLTGPSKVRWRTKQAGFRKLHLTLKLADGTWLVSDFGDGSSKDWYTREIMLQNIVWYELDLDLMSEMRPVLDPDLSNVVQIGFTDLMSGGRWFACSRLDWIEVYGNRMEKK